DRLADGGDERCGHRARGSVVCAILDDGEELVAADAGDGVGVARTNAEPRSQGAQQLISGIVAELVVDGFEAIEINTENGEEAAAPLGTRQSLLQTVFRNRAVGQAGEP